MTTESINNCNVYLSANTGISKGHHRYFASAGDADGFFRGKMIGSELSNMTIIRNFPSVNAWNKGCAHLPLKLKSCENAEYLSFLNTNVSSIVFHCKIYHCEYVNQNSTRVYFTPDWYATYIGYVKLGYAFIERGHVDKGEDVINRFLMLEDIDVPLPNKKLPWWQMDAQWKKYVADSYTVYSAADREENTNVADVKLRLLSSVPYYGYSLNSKNSSDIENYVKSYTKQQSGMQSMLKPIMSNVMAIKWQPEFLYSNTTSEPEPVLLNYPLRNVRNKKCFSPQYLSFKVFALSSGEHLAFNSLNMMKDSASIDGGGTNSLWFNFTIRASGSINAITSLYLDQNLDIKSNWIKQQPFPDIQVGNYQPAKYTDFGWYDRVVLKPLGNGLRTIISSTASGAVTGAAVGSAVPVVGTVAGAITGAAAGLGAATPSILSDVYQGVKEVYSVGDTAVSYTTVTQAGSDYANAVGMYGWEVVEYSPDDVYLSVLDDYFDRWGYRLSENRMVKLNVRGNFTYVKTIDANVTGQAPAVAIESINALLNSGCTFWQVEIGSTKYCG